jgi:hypothetical protein
LNDRHHGGTLDAQGELQHGSGITITGPFATQRWIKH